MRHAYRRYGAQGPNSGSYLLMLRVIFRHFGLQKPLSLCYEDLWTTIQAPEADMASAIQARYIKFNDMSLPLLRQRSLNSIGLLA